MCCNKCLKCGTDWKWGGRDWKNFHGHDGKSLEFLEQTLSSNVDANKSACKGAKGTELHKRK